MSAEDEHWLDDGEQEDESSAAPPTFILRERDENVIRGARRLAWKIARAPSTNPRYLVGLGRALYALDRLPAVTAGVNVKFSVRTPYAEGADMRLMRDWTVCVRDDEISIHSGGDMDVGTGSRGFEIMSWSATPTREPQRYEVSETRNVASYGRFPQGVPPLVFPPLGRWHEEVGALDLSSDWFKLDVTDSSREVEMEFDSLNAAECDDEQSEESAQRSWVDTRTRALRRRRWAYALIFVTVLGLTAVAGFPREAALFGLGVAIGVTWD